jgi:hypothetical protein
MLASEVFSLAPDSDPILGIKPTVPVGRLRPRRLPLGRKADTDKRAVRESPRRAVPSPPWRWSLMVDQRAPSGVSAERAPALEPDGGPSAVQRSLRLRWSLMVDQRARRLGQRLCLSPHSLQQSSLPLQNRPELRRQIRSPAGIRMLHAFLPSVSKIEAFLDRSQYSTIFLPHTSSSLNQ